MRPELYNPLVLAYIGDAILEVYVREYLVLEKNIQKPNQLQKMAVQYVSAKAQATFLKEAIANEWLSEEEISWYKRGRNAKNSRYLKNTDVRTHNESSGFEALIGTLHLNGNDERLNSLFKIYTSFIERGI